jgi:hypothetical protein
MTIPTGRTAGVEGVKKDTAITIGTVITGGSASSRTGSCDKMLVYTRLCQSHASQMGLIWYEPAWPKNDEFSSGLKVAPTAFALSKH